MFHRDTSSGNRHTSCCPSLAEPRARSIACCRHFEGGYMSDQIIVATFSNSNAAYDAATALKALKDKGVVDFKPKAGVMVKKDDKGNLSLLESKDRPLWGRGIGAVAGAP